MNDRSPLELQQNKELYEVFVNGTLVFRHTPGNPAIVIGYGEPKITASHGAHTIKPGLRWRRYLKKASVRESGPERITLEFSSGNGDRVAVSFVLDSLDARIARVAFLCEEPVTHDRIWITLPATRNEPTFGGGVQFSRFNLRGSRLPLWTGEQGVGRGFNATTLAANLHSGSGGQWHSTYFPQPSYVTGTGRAVHVQSTAYARFDFKGTDDVLEIWEPSCEFLLGAGSSLEGAVQLLSAELGRQPRLPGWVDNGMWLGLQGGTEVVRSKIERAREADIALGGVWVQDWVGRRVTSFGSQLFWDWKYDSERYPDLPRFTAELREQGIRFLGYVNPFLAIEGELYKEASPAGYCVKDASGSDAMIVVTTFPAALVDLSNPDAWAWFKKVIQENMLGAGLSGWMADYGEYLPTNALLANGDAMTFHNRYPAEWARLNYEAVSEAGKLDDTVVFMRAGHTGTSRYAHSIWAGDQMVDWSRHDGLPSVIPASLSAGMVGIGVSHSDVGGFTSLFGKRRDKELFLRWAEHAAFTPIMRSHESNRPEQNWQWDSDAESITHLSRMARVFVELGPYRRAVLSEYYDSGLPAMRPPKLHYPEIAAGRRADAYLFGRDLFVQPVTRKGAKRSAVQLPDDDWTHLWTGRKYTGGTVTVDAPAGFPPVFYRSESTHVPTFSSIAGL